MYAQSSINLDPDIYIIYQVDLISKYLESGTLKHICVNIGVMDTCNATYHRTQLFSSLNPKIFPGA